MVYAELLFASAMQAQNETSPTPCPVPSRLGDSIAALFAVVKPPCPCAPSVPDTDTLVVLQPACRFPPSKGSYSVACATYSPVVSSKEKATLFSTDVENWKELFAPAETVPKAGSPVGVREP